MALRQQHKPKSDSSLQQHNPKHGNASLEQDKISQLEALRRAGEFASVEAVANALLGKNPDAVILYNFLGLAQQSLGKLDAAVSSFQRGLDVDPEFADLHLNLGSALMSAGRSDDAARSYLEALRLEPGSARFLQIAATDFFKMRNVTVSEPVVSLLIRCIESDDVEEALVKKLSRSIIFAALRQKLIAGANVLQVYAHIDCATHGLLTAYLEHCTLNHSYIERFLTAVRAEFLNVYARQQDDGRLASFEIQPIAALAFQCLWNEHIWYESEEERRLVDQLQANLIDAIKDGDNPDEREVCLLASYRPLHSLEPVKSWAAAVSPKSANPLKKLLKLFISDPEKERELKRQLKRVTAVSDKISLEVQSQYEENPYPRWVKSPVAIPNTYTDHILRHIDPHSPLLKPSTDKPRILVAGCGTGQHPIRTALNCANSSVLAIDLSAASLAYAMHRAEAMNVSNVEFAQADILKLDELEETFDMIEAAGVIHHMAEPLVGLQKLLDRLKPDGFLRLGLYSELAREEIVQLREELEGQALDLSAKGIRNFRHALQGNDHVLFAKLAERGDFYTTSNLRDLIFHVQEHRFTIPQLQKILGDHKLKFLGFIFNDPRIKAKYQAEFPGDPTCTNLDNWHLYEQRHPSTFSNMYQFWCTRFV